MTVSDTAAAEARWSDGTAPGDSAPRAFRVFVLVTLGLSIPLVTGLVLVLAPLEALDLLLVTLFALNTLWVSAAAATSLIGLGPVRSAPEAPASWHPTDRTAVLFFICGEDPEGVARRVAAMYRDLARRGDEEVTDIWLLSDTSGPTVSVEERAVELLIEAGILRYRRRARNDRRKPGNLSDWIERHGDGYQSMLVMDADSTMTADCLSGLRYRMERDPRLGLLQSGIAIRPETTRFGRLQRLSARLTGPVFTRGLDAWAGTAGNYWGHNALIRTEAFRGAMRLPPLRGPAPYGGDFLSHDFIEAAWLVRAGWQVEIAPDTRGSSEAGPGDLESFHRRDRRWCQGNLQHLRALFGHRLHAKSRIHLASGVQSYLSSPIWLALILLFLTAGMAPGAVPVLSGALALLLVPKIAAILRFRRRTQRASRRRVFLRATAAELWQSTLLSPLVMVRQTLSVCAVLIGRDCGWKGPRRQGRPMPRGSVEALAGAALVAVAVTWGDHASQAIWLTLIAGPLLAAPWLAPWLDRKVTRGC